jgi:hypothetical protein
MVMTTNSNKTDVQRPKHLDPLLPGLPLERPLLDQTPKLIHEEQEQSIRKAPCFSLPYSVLRGISFTDKRGPLVIWKYGLGLGASSGLHSKFGLRNFAGRPQNLK